MSGTQQIHAPEDLLQISGCLLMDQMQPIPKEFKSVSWADLAESEITNEQDTPAASSTKIGPSTPKKDSYVSALIGKSMANSSAKNVDTATQPVFASKTVKSGMVQINQNALQERLELSKYSLIARLVLSNGDQPWKIPELKLKLGKLWNLDKWKLISIGNGFFHVLLHSEEDKQKVWSFSSIHLKPGSLRLQEWNPAFNPLKQKATNTQVCVRFYNLSWLFWYPQILADIGSNIVVPLKFDNATLNGEFGHFARMLIDVDLAASLPTSILLDNNGDCMEIEIRYEYLHLFCSFCNNIGHGIAACRALKKHPEESKNSRKDPTKSTPENQDVPAKAPTTLHVSTADKSYSAVSTTAALAKENAQSAIALTDSYQGEKTATTLVLTRANEQMQTSKPSVGSLPESHDHIQAQLTMAKLLQVSPITNGEVMTHANLVSSPPLIIENYFSVLENDLLHNKILGNVLNTDINNISDNSIYDTSIDDNPNALALVVHEEALNILSHENTDTEVTNKFWQPGLKDPAETRTWNRERKRKDLTVSGPAGRGSTKSNTRANSFK